MNLKILLKKLTVQIGIFIRNRINYKPVDLDNNFKTKSSISDAFAGELTMDMKQLLNLVI